MIYFFGSSSSLPSTNVPSHIHIFSSWATPTLSFRQFRHAMKALDSTNQRRKPPTMQAFSVNSWRTITWHCHARTKGVTKAKDTFFKRVYGMAPQEGWITLRYRRQGWQPQANPSCWSIPMLTQSFMITSQWRYTLRVHSFLVRPSKQSQGLKRWIQSRCKKTSDKLYITQKCSRSRIGHLSNTSTGMN